MSSGNGAAAAAAVEGPTTSSTQHILGGALRMIDLKSVLDRVLERIYAEFGNLMKQSEHEQDSGRKRLLLSYLHSTRQQLLRLMVLMQGCNKVKALAECVDHDKVLDKAASHARVLQSAVDDLYVAHLERAGRCSPMWDVQTALEILTSGAYNDLPSAIEGLFPSRGQSGKQQQRKLGRVTHLIHSHLLKAQLPTNLELVCVQDGYAVLNVPGLYEMKLTIVPTAPVPVAANKALASTSGNGIKAEDAEHGDEEDVTSGPKPVRWRWLLLEFAFLAGSAHSSPLQEQQVLKLLQDLNNRMQLAADAAAYAKQEPVLEASIKIVKVEDPLHPKAEASEAVTSASRPQPSVGDPPAASGPVRAANLEVLAQHAADENTRPLLTAHFILSDIASRLLVESTMAAVHRVGGSGGRWGGHVSMHHSKRLRPGILINYWISSVQLISLPEVTGEIAVKAESGVDAPPPVIRQVPLRPQLEIGVGASGNVEVHHIPSLKLIASAANNAGGAESSGGFSASMPDLKLDAGKVNVDELLLQAAAFLAIQELYVLQQRLLLLLQRSGLLPACRLVLVPSVPWSMVPDSSNPPDEDASMVVAAATAVQSWGGGTGAKSTGVSPSAVVMQGRGEGAAVSSSGAFSCEQPQSGRSTVNVPALDFYVDDLLLARLSKSLISGRLLLRPGPGMANDVLIEHLGTWAAKEEELDVSLHAAFNRPSSDASGAGPSARAINEVALRLNHFFKSQHKHCILSRTITCTRKLRLHLGGPGPAVCDAFYSSHPWINMKRYAVNWSFEPPGPFDPSLPPLEFTPPGTPSALVPRTLLFVLATEHPSTPAVSYMLLICFCNSQGVQLKIAKALPVPSQVWMMSPPVALASPPSVHLPYSSHVGPAATPGTPQETAYLQMGTCISRAFNEVPQPSPVSPSAQRDIARELECVVAWCRQRMVWENLLVQLKALSIDFTEVSISDKLGGTNQLTISSLGGIQFPCKFPRCPIRQIDTKDGRNVGATPPSVGVTGVELQLGAASSREEFVAHISGCFFAPVEKRHSSHSGCLMLRYDLRHQSIVSMVSDIKSIIQTQRMLCRLEALSAALESKPLPTVICSPGAGLAYWDVTHRPADLLLSQRGTKRAKLDQNHSSAAGVTSNGGLKHGAPDHSEDACTSLTWRWPHSGAIYLQQYTHSSVNLRFTPISAENQEEDGEPMMVDGETNKATRHSSSPARHHDFVVSWSSRGGRSNSPSTGDKPSCKCHISVQGLPKAVVHSFEEMIELEEEGMLLDAMAVTCLPMSQLGLLLAARKELMDGHSSCLVEVHTSPPYRHRLLRKHGGLDVSGGLPKSGITGEGPEFTEAVPPFILTVDVACMAVGKTWVKVTVEVDSAGFSLGASPKDTASASQIAQKLCKRLLSFGPHVALPTSSGVTPTFLKSRSKSNEEPRSAQIWALVGSEHLRLVLARLLAPVNK